jgi:multiple sugar transport system permease protein
MLAGVPAGYVLARRQARWSRPAAVFVLGTRFLPPLAIVLPFFAFFARIGMIDSLIGLIVVYVSINISIVIWMTMGFVRDIPREIEESAMVDGAGPFGAIRYITIPLIKGGLASTAIFIALLAWNEFMMALVLTNTEAITAPVAALAYIRHMYIAWGPLTAAGTLIAVPILIFALIIQRRLVRGLTAGAIQG